MSTAIDRRLLDREAQENFKRRGVALGCRVCPARGETCEGTVQAHHLVRAQVIRRHVRTVAFQADLSKDETADLMRELMWASVNSLGVCERAHRRHHNRTEPIAFSLVPLAAVVWATKHGLAYAIEREYPVEEEAA